MNKIILIISLLSTLSVAFRGGRSLSLIGVEEDTHGLIDPSSYASVFEGPNGASNLIQIDILNHPKKPIISPPASFLQRNDDTSQWKSFFTPFSSLEEAKSASVKLAASEEALGDKESITRSKIEAFKNEILTEIDSARHEKKQIQDRLAQRGSSIQSFSSSSFVQLDQTTHREIEKINEMARGWKLAADRLSHSDLSSNDNPNAALIDANTKVEADRKKLNRLSLVINDDMKKVENDAAIVIAQEGQLRKDKQIRDYAPSSGI